MRERLQQTFTWLGTPRGALFILGLATALVLVSLGGGIQTEDYFHAGAVREGAARWPDRLQLFFYVPGNKAHIYHLKEYGLLPWMAVEDYRVMFWRPFSSLTHIFDYHYFEHQPWVMHAHSMLWHGGLVLAAAAIYRRVCASPIVAGAAGLLYALDDAHGPVVGWLANRNALLTACFSLAALWAHDRWRRGGSLPAAVAAPLLLGMGYLSAEATIGVLGYFLGHALWMDRDTARRRALALLPAATVTLLWATNYFLGGYGVRGTDFHISPLVDPGGYAREFWWRAPALIGSLLGGPSSDAWLVLDFEQHALYGALGWAGCGVTCAALWRLGAFATPASKMFALGAGLAVFPAAIAMPQDRSLMLMGLGGFGVLATLIGRALEHGDGKHLTLRVGSSHLAALAILGVHGLWSAHDMHHRSLTLKHFGGLLKHSVDSALAEHPRLDQDLILVNGPSHFFPTLAFGVERAKARPIPKSRLLFGGRGSVTVTRLDLRTLRMDAPQSFITDPFDTSYWGRTRPFTPDYGLQLGGMLIRVRAVDSIGRPTRVDFIFARALEGPRYRFLAFEKGDYIPWSIPPIGSHKTLNAN